VSVQLGCLEALKRRTCRRSAEQQPTVIEPKDTAKATVRRKPPGSASKLSTIFNACNVLMGE
jgi:hypothetical protein